MHQCIRPSFTLYILRFWPLLSACLSVCLCICTRPSEHIFVCLCPFLSLTHMNEYNFWNYLRYTQIFSPSIEIYALSIVVTFEEVVIVSYMVPWPLKTTVIVMLTLVSRVAPQVVMTISGATSGNKVGIMPTFGFNDHSHKKPSFASNTTRYVVATHLHSPVITLYALHSLCRNKL